jgi:predicted nucleic acid-binding protein
VTQLLLVDKSAYVRGVNPADYDAELCLCAITELELLYSARSAGDYLLLEQRLAEFRSLRMDAETFAAARSAQRALAERGRHRVPLAELLIAACAQQHGAAVLHVDRHYELLAGVMGFEAVRPA